MLSPGEPLVFDTSTLREVRRWPTDGLRSLSLRGITCVVPTVVLAEYGRYRFAAAQRLGIEQRSLSDIEAELADAHVQVTPTDAQVVAALLDWTLNAFDTPEAYGHFKSRLAISSTSHFWWRVVQAEGLGGRRRSKGVCRHVRRGQGGCARVQAAQDGADPGRLVGHRARCGGLWPAGD